jgi:hypothetical protein
MWINLCKSISSKLNYQGRKNQQQEKSWYETAGAKRRFEDYGRIVKNERWITVATVGAFVVAVIALLKSC